MKKFGLLLTLNLFLLLGFAFSNDILSQNVPHFDSTYYQFNLNETISTRRHTAARTADMDNDGDSDVVSSHGTFFSSGFTFLRNLGNGFFSAPTHYAASLFSNDVAVGDFYNDGLKDVVVSNTGINWQGNSVSVFLNLGNAAFGAAVNYTVGQGPIGVTAAD